MRIGIIMFDKDLINWPGSVAKAKQIQRQLAQQVKLSTLTTAVNTIAGIDVAFPDHGKTTRAAIVVVSYPDLKVLEQASFELATELPYIPGVLSFREGKAIISALTSLSIQPDLLMFDGQGITHPLGLGIASHIGVLLNKPTIGVAKSCLIGEYSEPALTKASYQGLFIDGQESAYVVRSRNKVKPIFVSPGHLITKEQALELALNCVTKYRLPEPTRLADKLSKCRSLYLPS